MDILKKIAGNISKFIYFIILLVCAGHILPVAENYINERFATQWALFFYGDQSAESMYDAFSDIDWIIMLAIVIPFYILTVKLIKKIRNK